MRGSNCRPPTTASRSSSAPSTAARPSSSGRTMSMPRATCPASGFDLTGYEGNYHVWEGFTEARMPLAKNLPGVKTLDFEARYRYSSYTSGFNTNTYKFGLKWAPDSGRSPASQLQPGGPRTEPRGTAQGAVRHARFRHRPVRPRYPVHGGAVCAHGLVAGHLQRRGQACSAQLGSRSVQRPVRRQHVTASLRWVRRRTWAWCSRRASCSGFSATVDYTDIKMTDVITTYGPNLIQANCIAPHGGERHRADLVRR